MLKSFLSIHWLSNNFDSYYAISLKNCFFFTNELIFFVLIWNICIFHRLFPFTYLTQVLKIEKYLRHQQLFESNIEYFKFNETTKFFSSIRNNVQETANDNMMFFHLMKFAALWLDNNFIISFQPRIASCKRDTVAGKCQILNYSLYFMRHVPREYFLVIWNLDDCQFVFKHWDENIPEIVLYDG